MEATHLFAVIPLLAFLILSLVFSKSGLLHLATLFYSLVLGWLAVINTWEVLFFPVVVITSMISIILFIHAMVKGDWL